MSFQFLNISKIKLFRGFSQLFIEEYNSKYFHSPSFHIIRKFQKSEFPNNSQQEIGNNSLKSKYLEFVENDETLVKSMVKLFPYPKLVFKNFLHLSATSGKNYDYSVLFEELGRTHEPIFVCNLKLNGPIHETFSGHGLSKKQAEAAASLKVINILFNEKLIDQKGRPFIASSSSHYNVSENGLPLSEPQKVSLSDDILHYKSSNNNNHIVNQSSENEKLLDVDEAVKSKFLTSIENDEILVKAIPSLFSNPKSVIKNYFQILTDSGEKHKYIVKIDKFGKPHEPIFVCNLELVGPVHTIVSGYARNKKRAEEAATLKALNLLFKEKFMDYKGKPSQVFSSQRHKKKQLDKPHKISLSDDILQEAEDVIQKYENNIKPVVEQVYNKYMEAVISLDSERNTEVIDFMTGDTLTFDGQNYDIDVDLFLKLSKITNEKGKSLPIYNEREEILESLKNNSAIIIEAGTGCGKSTQVPQIIFNDWIERKEGSLCNIIIAQPRRLATVFVARRVAVERDQKIGDSVGYKMRLESKMLKRRGGIMFYTCGSLRQMMHLNPQLKGISHIIIDEVHERSIDTDILLLLLKNALSKGATFKLILMSASARVKDLQSYLNIENIIRAPSGNLFPVKTYYAENFPPEIPSTNYEIPTELPDAMSPPDLSYNYVIQMIRYIHKEKPEGSILVFLPGWHDIKTLKHLLENDNELWVLPLHSILGKDSQNIVFEKDPFGKRKVILSTNIAETSVTINDVVYVIDSGLQNEFGLVLSRNVSSLRTVWITKANVIQRKGRVGRTQPGEFYCLYSEETFKKMDEFPTPEICRLPLENVVLRCKTLFKEISAKDLLKELPNPPMEIAVEKALGNLQHLQLIERRQDDSENETLTPLGQLLATYPSSPFFTKPLVYSALLECVEPTLNYICLENGFSKLFLQPLSNSQLRNFKWDYSNLSDILAMSRFISDVLKEMMKRNVTVTRDGRFERSYTNGDNDRGVEVDDKQQLITDDMYDILSNLSPERLYQPLKVKEAHEALLLKYFPDLVASYFYEEETNEGSEEKLKLSRVQAGLTIASFVSASNYVINRTRRRGMDQYFLEGSRLFVHGSSILSKCVDLDESLDLFIPGEISMSELRKAYVARDLSYAPPISVALFFGENLNILPSNKSVSDVQQELVHRIENRNIFFTMDQRTSNCIVSLRKLWTSILNFYVIQKLESDLEESEEAILQKNNIDLFVNDLRKLMKEILLLPIDDDYK